MIALSRGDHHPLVALAWRGEEELLSPRVRSDSVLLRELLAEDFYEIGQSGKRWGREEIIAALVTEENSFPDAVLSEREAQLIAQDIVLLSYRLQFGEKQSLRSSLWRGNGDWAQCVFHQGTPSSRR